MSLLRLLFACVLLLELAGLAQAPPPSPQMAAANQLLQAKKFDEAATAFETVVKEQPANPRAWYQLAVARFSLEHFAAAAEAFEKSFSLAPNPTALYNAACAYARMGNKEKALAALERIASGTAPLFADPAADSDLASLRTEPRFQEVLTNLDQRRRPCMYVAEARQLDFWVGEWDVFNPQGQQAGTSSIQQVAEGCAILENWRSGVGTTGKSLNFYDAGNKKWYQYWIGPTGVPSRYSGIYADGALRYVTEPFVANGKKTVSRLTFFNVDPNTVRQLAESSTDEGATWSVNYDFKYVRRK